MADFIITDIVSREAIEQINTLNTALTRAQQEYARLAAEIARDSVESSKSFQDLSRKVREYEARIQQLQTVQGQYAKSYAALEKELQAVKRDLDAARVAAQQNDQAQQAAGTAATQAAQGAQAYSQAVTSQRDAALAAAQALEAQRAAMLAKWKLDADSKRLMDEQLGSYNANIDALQRYDAQLKAISVERKKLTTDEQSGIITSKEAAERRRELLVTERELKAGKSETLRLLRSEEKQSQAAAGSYQQLSLELTKMKNAYKTLNDEQRRSESGQKLLANIQQLDTALKGTAGTMGEHNREVGNYEQAILAALGVNGRFATSLMNLSRAGGGMAGMFAAAGTAVKSFGRALWTLATNPVFLTLAGIGGAVASLKWLYDYNQKVAESTRLTREFLGVLDTATVEAYRAEIQGLADTYGKEFKDVLQAADTLVNQYGASWGEALDVINRGFAAGADLNGTFLSQVKQYAPSFRDAGVKMEQLVALIAQTRSGIFSEQGMSLMQMAFKRITEGGANVQKSLEAIGIDAKKLARDLANDVLDPIDALRLISEQLNKVGENSQAAGAVLRDVFGRQGAAGGMMLVKSLKDISGNLDEVQKKTGEWGELQKRLVRSQQDLTREFDAFFNLSGQGWENFITQVKIIVNEWLAKFIVQVRHMINRFVEWYNASASLRIGLAGILAVLNAIMNVQRATFGMLLDILKQVGRGIHGATQAFDGLWHAVSNPTDALTGLRKVKAGVQEIMNAAGSGMMAIPKAVAGMVRDNITQGVAGIKNARGNRLSPIGGLSGFTPLGVAGTGGGGSGGYLDDSGSGGSTKSGSASKNAAAEAKRIEDILKRLNATRLQLIEDEYERERETLRANYDEQIAEIKGNSAAEIELRANFAKLRDRELADLAAKHTDDLRAIEEKNLQNLMAGYEGEAQQTMEYIKLRQRLLEVQREREIYAAEKEGADVANVHHKYNQLMMSTAQSYNEILLQKEQEWQAAREQQRAKELSDEQTRLAKALQAGMMTREQYEQKSSELQTLYAQEEAQATIDGLKKILATIPLTNAERLELEKKLHEAEIALNAAKNKAIEEADAQHTAKINAMWEKRIEIVQTAQKFVGEFSQLGRALFEREAQSLEEAQERLDKAYEAEEERITRLAEKGQITTEEAERRKENAEKKHAAEKEKLAKKEAEIKRKQAVFDKANSASQTIMNTAVAIMQAWRQNPLTAPVQTALISALGAVQLATILAQPIPKYAKGTESHKGGLAVVGDGGRRELVLTGGGAYITPARPTLVDMPKGAFVHPDAAAILSGSVIRQADELLRRNGGALAPIVNVDNDYTALERATRENTAEIRRLQRLVVKGQTDGEYKAIYARL